MILVLNLKLSWIWYCMSKLFLTNIFKKIYFDRKLHFCSNKWGCSGWSNEKPEDTFPIFQCTEDTHFPKHSQLTPTLGCWFLLFSLSLSPLFLGSVLNVQHFPNDNFLFLSTSSSSFSIFPQTRIGGQSTSVKRNLTHWQNKKQKQLGSRWKMWKYICLHQTNHQSWFSPFVFLKVILLLNYAPFNKTLDKKNQ